MYKSDEWSQEENTTDKENSHFMKNLFKATISVVGDCLKDCEMWVSYAEDFKKCNHLEEAKWFSEKAHSRLHGDFKKDYDKMKSVASRMVINRDGTSNIVIEALAERYYDWYDSLCCRIKNI